MKIGLTEARIQVSADTPTFYPLLFLPPALWRALLAFFFCSPGYHSVTHQESDKTNSFLTLLSRFYAVCLFSKSSPTDTLP